MMIGLSLSQIWSTIASAEFNQSSTWTVKSLTVDFPTPIGSYLKDKFECLIITSNIIRIKLGPERNQILLA